MTTLPGELDREWRGSCPTASMGWLEERAVSKAGRAPTTLGTGNMSRE